MDKIYEAYTQVINEREYSWGKKTATMKVTGKDLFSWFYQKPINKITTSVAKDIKNDFDVKVDNEKIRKITDDDILILSDSFNDASTVKFRLDTRTGEKAGLYVIKFYIKTKDNKTYIFDSMKHVNKDAIKHGKNITVKLDRQWFA